MKLISKYKIEIGLCVWLLWAVFYLPHPLEPQWGYLLVLFAALVIVPLVFDILKKVGTYPSFLSKTDVWQLPCALFFVIAYSLPKSIHSGMLSLPWLLFSFANLLGVIVFLIKNKNKISLTNLVTGAAFSFLFIGAIWAVFDRFGFRPLGYDAEIVFLTVAHFHYAGFVLPVVAGLAAKRINKLLGKIMTAGIVFGVIFVAIGIVATQLGGSPKIETFAAWWLAVSAILLAGMHIYFSIENDCMPSVSLFWTLAGVSLLAGMFLAALYGMRHIWAMPGLDIEWMRALHGSANVFGFSLFSVIGWRNYISNQ